MSLMLEALKRIEAKHAYRRAATMVESCAPCATAITAAPFDSMDSFEPTEQPPELTDDSQFETAPVEIAAPDTISLDVALSEISGLIEAARLLDKPAPDNAREHAPCKIDMEPSLSKDGAVPEEAPASKGETASNLPTVNEETALSNQEVSTVEAAASVAEMSLSIGLFCTPEEDAPPNDANVNPVSDETQHAAAPAETDDSCWFWHATSAVTALSDVPITTSQANEELQAEASSLFDATVASLAALDDLSDLAFAPEVEVEVANAAWALADAESAVAADEIAVDGPIAADGVSVPAEETVEPSEAVVEFAEPPVIEPVGSDPYAATASQIVRQLPPGRSQVLMFTSPGDGHGKTTTLARLVPHLARSVAGNVLVVDANTRNPDMARRLDVAATWRLTDVLAGATDWMEAVRPTGLPRVSVLPGGTDRSRRPGAQAVARLLRELAAHYDLVVVDSTSLAHRGAAQLAAMCDATYLVVRLGEGGRRIVREAVEVINKAGGRLYGCIAIDAGG